MELDIVNFEQAKALKELGFPVDCTSKYYTNDGELYDWNEIESWDNKYYDKNPAPELELVAKWLRNEKKIYIDVTWGNMQNNIVWCASINNLGKGSSMLGDVKHINYVNSYEEVLSAGIDKVIEILKSNE